MRYIKRNHLFFLWTSVLAILIFASWAVTFGCAVKVVDVDAHTEIHVDAFRGGTLRFQIVRHKRQDYQFNASVVAVPSEKLTTNCKDTRCIITAGPCRMEVAMSEAAVGVGYSCDGILLNSAMYSTSSMDHHEWRFVFPSALTLYGVPEHAADLPLRAGQKYSLYNVDAFQYSVNSTESLYGAIPFLMAYGPQHSTGVLFLNGAEMSVKLLDEAVPTCEWHAETGIVDVFFFPGPTPTDVQRQHATITGPTVFPPYFALGYHQSRWNYVNSRDVLTVNQDFDQHHMPYDTLWLDIEHQDNKKTFTWDSFKFPDPLRMSQELQKSGRHLVTIKDPFVKEDSGYDVFRQGSAEDYFVLAENGGPYRGRCWPGKTVWPDFINGRTRAWYAHFFHENHYPGSRHIHTWVDMNEPSVFEEERGTMPKSNIHITDDGRKVRHGEVHNAYGFYSLMAVYQGSLEALREPDHPEVVGSNGLPVPYAELRRPFILTRSFFPGSQRYAAMWTGDNTAKWSHLQNAIPELLSLSISNYPFVGCDVGGFFSNPSEELFVRWMQAGIFFPFFRSHNHFESRRREPWMVSVENQVHMRNALGLRYALLPYMYSTFYEAHISGDTVMKPLFYVFPEQPDLRESQSTFLLGSALLAHPVLYSAATEVSVVFPAFTMWYSFSTGQLVNGAVGGGVSFPVDMSTIPLFIRGGHIVPVKRRVRRSAAAARYDPYTLYVALNDQGASSGTLYLDDGESFMYQRGAYTHRQFLFSFNGDTFVLRNVEHFWSSSTYTHFFSLSAVEEVVIYGNPTLIKRVFLQNDMNDPVECSFEQHRGVVTVKLQYRPLIMDNWSLHFIV